MAHSTGAGSDTPFPPLPDDMGRFSARDRDAISARLAPCPGWTVDYTVEGEVEYALMRREGWGGDAPVLSLVRDAGLTAPAARWPDGSELTAALCASLSVALGFVACWLDEAWEMGLVARMPG